MPRFNYRARDAQGQLVQGTVEANDRAGAIQLMEQRRCVPIKIEAAGGAKPAAPPRPTAAAKRGMTPCHWRCGAVTAASAAAPVAPTPAPAGQRRRR